MGVGNYFLAAIHMAALMSIPRIMAESCNCETSAVQKQIEQGCMALSGILSALVIVSMINIPNEMLKLAILAVSWIGISVATIVFLVRNKLKPTSSSACGKKLFILLLIFFVVIPDVVVVGCMLGTYLKNKPSTPSNDVAQS